MVEEKTNGEIEVRAYHASKLGDKLEALEGIRMGTIQMGTLTFGPVPCFFISNLSAQQQDIIQDAALVLAATHNGFSNEKYHNITD